MKQVLFLIALFYCGVNATIESRDIYKHPLTQRPISVSFFLLFLIFTTHAYLFLTIFPFLRVLFYFYFVLFIFYCNKQVQYVDGFSHPDIESPELIDTLSHFLSSHIEEYGITNVDTELQLKATTHNIHFPEQTISTFIQVNKQILFSYNSVFLLQKL